MAEIVVRQRSLLRLGARGPIEGWMDDDVASAATQLFGSGPRGLLVIDARELPTSTARVVGAQLGELHFKALMAIITLHVAQGMLADGSCGARTGPAAARTRRSSCAQALRSARACPRQGSSPVGTR